MDIEEISAVGVVRALEEMNPWWDGKPVGKKVPESRRLAWKKLERWLTEPPTYMAVGIIGPRYVGKTTAINQMVKHLLAEGIPGRSILFANFVDRRLRVAGIDMVVEGWLRQLPEGIETKYLFFDEIQLAQDWGHKVKAMVDDHKDRRIFFTGSALSIYSSPKETGGGRWTEINMGTLTFGEYMMMCKGFTDGLPKIDHETNMTRKQQSEITAFASELNPMFEEFLLKGGFPHTARMSNIAEVQALLNESISNVLTSDIQDFSNSQRSRSLTLLHNYFCESDCALLNASALASSLGVSVHTINGLMDTLEASQLIKRLPSLSFGKQTLTGRTKVYVNDQSITAAYLRHERMDTNYEVVGKLVESAVFWHLSNHARTEFARLGYWRKNKLEIDFVFSQRGNLVPIEVKYRNESLRRESLRGFKKLNTDKGFDRCYLVTKSHDDVGIEIPSRGELAYPTLVRLPASVFCLLLSDTSTGSDYRFNL